MLNPEAMPTPVARWRPTWAIVIDLVVGLALVAGLVATASVGIQFGGYVVVFLFVFAPFLVAAGVELVLTIAFVFTGGRALFYAMLAGGLAIAYLGGATLSGGLSQLVSAWLRLVSGPG